MYRLIYEFVEFFIFRTWIWCDASFLHRGKMVHIDVSREEIVFRENSYNIGCIKNELKTYKIYTVLIDIWSIH